MLYREGVVLQHSTGTVVWAHAWLGEFAAIERLMEQLKSPSAKTIAEAVSGIKPDHAARTAARGGCKWIVSHPDLGRVEDYLRTLYAANKGFAREALAVLIEDSPRHLDLAKLSTPLLLNAITDAREMGMPQWRGQVALLPDSLFTKPDGPALQLAVFRYESEVKDNG